MFLLNEVLQHSIILQFSSFTVRGGKPKGKQKGPQHTVPTKKTEGAVKEKFRARGFDVPLLKKIGLQSPNGRLVVYCTMHPCRGGVFVKTLSFFRSFDC